MIFNARIGWIIKENSNSGGYRYYNYINIIYTVLIFNKILIAVERKALNEEHWESMEEYKFNK